MLDLLAQNIFLPFLLYGYAAVFLGVMLDNAGFPVPGELVLLLVGSLVASGHFGLLPAIAIAASGALLSDSGWYYAGRRGSRGIIRMYCSFSFGSAACLARTEQQLSRFGPKSLLYARFIPGFRTFAAPMAGMSGIPYRLFALYDGVGAVLWATLGIYTGTLFADRINALSGMLQNTRTVLFHLVLTLLLLFLLTKWLVRRKHGLAMLPERQAYPNGKPLMERVSIVIPVLNESASIVQTLELLQVSRNAGHEIIVVDGGSIDNTIKLSSKLADMVVTSQRGRARQMNTGASYAKGDVLLFLHADTQLPDDALQAILEGLSVSGKRWGRFDVRLSGHHPMLRIVERMISWRSRVTGIATGDQAMFMRREAYEQVGGFPEIPLMEDIAMSRDLNVALGRPLCLRIPVTTSSRRWEEHGILRTILLMWKLRLAYFFGRPPEWIAQQYARRETSNGRT